MHSKFNWLHSRFPKKRPTLPDAYIPIYENEYKRNRGYQQSNLTYKQKLEGWMHLQAAKTQAPEGPTLEIGAGTLNHLQYEQNDHPYDIIEPFLALYQDQPMRKRLRTIYQSISDIPVNERYAKIISIAVLEHLEDLPRLVAKSALLLQDDGVAIHGIPNEGGLLWYLAWRFGTGLSFRFRTGKSYKPLMHYEHINNAEEILHVLNMFFDEVSFKRYPLPSLHCSFYTSIVLKKPDKDAAIKFLDGVA